MVKGDLRPSKRYPASKKEKKIVAKALSSLFQGLTPETVEHVEFRDGTVMYIVDGTPCIIIVDDRVIPHLKCLLSHRAGITLPLVIVDRGATAAVGRGADLMVPGIRGMEGEFEAGDLVVVMDEEARVPVAVGEALLSSEEIREKLAGERRGKAVKILHRPGDRYWKMAEAL
ncbi:MAG: DUF1947 domain-containing protein [Desulfurococcales archaeon]|nr:DUF1947 domain-containing protein [Desulfurococcales archaeon]